MKTNSLFFLSVALLVGCCANQIKETPTEEQTVAPPIEAVEEADTDADTVGVERTSVIDNPHTFANMVNETTFMDPDALDVWEDYQSIVEDISYGDMDVLRKESPVVSDLDGTSQREIGDLFSVIHLRDDVIVEKVAIADGEEMHLYRYPAPAESGLSKISDFLVELSFYYADDHLMFSSITPGLYELNVNDLPTAETVTSLTKVSEIEALNPQVLTVAEMEFQGNLIQQIMIPGIALTEEGQEAMAAFYLFTQGDDILYYAFLPFELVSQSFPDYSLIIFGEILPEMAEVVF